MCVCVCVCIYSSGSRPPNYGDCPQTVEDRNVLAMSGAWAYSIVHYQ